MSSPTADSIQVTSHVYATSLATDAVTTNDWGPLGCVRPERPSDFAPWNNPQNLITKETADLIKACFSGGVIPLLWLVGSVGNVLSCTVFYRQGLNNRINLCLFSLGLADFATLWAYTLPHLEQVTKNYLFFNKYLTGLTGFSWLSQFLSTVIASERCLAVVSPLKAQRYLSARRMGAFIGLSCAVLMAGFLAVVSPKVTVVCSFDPATNVTRDILYVTNWYLHNKEVVDVIDVFFYSVSLPAAFLVIIMVTTAVTAVQLRAAVRWRARTVYAVASRPPAGRREVIENDKGPGSDRRQRHGQNAESRDPKPDILSSRTSHPNKPDSISMPLKEAALTRMLMATSVLFMICLSPTLMLQIASFADQRLTGQGVWANLETVLWGVVAVARVLNSTLNFFVYCVMGSRFRETLKEILASCCCCCCCCCLVPRVSGKGGGVEGASSIFRTTVYLTTSSGNSSSSLASG